MYKSLNFMCRTRSSVTSLVLRQSENVAHTISGCFKPVPRNVKLDDIASPPQFHTISQMTFSAHANTRWQHSQNYLVMLLVGVIFNYPMDSRARRAYHGRNTTGRDIPSLWRQRPVHDHWRSHAGNYFPTFWKHGSRNLSKFAFWK